MKNLLTLIFLITLSFNLSAQANCDCKPELDFVYAQMKKMNSFKHQVKGNKKTEFENLYQKLRGQMTNEMTKVDCFWKLNQLEHFVNDKHAEVYEPRPDYTMDDIFDSTFIKSYRTSDAFKNHPKVDLDLTQLKTQLKSKPAAGIEGIYNAGSLMKLGVYRFDADSLVGVVLESQISIWEPGQIYAYIKQTDSPSRFNIVLYGQLYKNLIFAEEQLFENGQLFSTTRKEGSDEAYDIVNVTSEEAESFKLTRLNDDVQYVWMNSFNRSTMRTNRDQLITQIEDELNSPYLIVDLRNNVGGSDKISKPIIKAIKKSKAQVYVLTNFYTGSNGELTTGRLRKLKNTVHLGQTTYGALGYGTNYGRTYTSPSGMFTYAPTDMRQASFLPYENQGIGPDIKLDANTDWVEQTLAIIEGSK